MEQTRHAVRDVVENPWVERGTRLGFAVRGVIYSTTGLLAVALALGARNAEADYESALQLIGAQPFGQLMLVVIAVGLAALSLWNFSRVVYDPLGKGEGEGRQQQFERLGALIGGISYSVLFITALRVLLGPNFLVFGPREAANPESVAASLLGTPWGPWLLGLIGAVVLGYGFVQLYRAWRSDFEKEFKNYVLSPAQTKWACRLGRWGTAARGVVIGLVGLFLLQAALRVDPEDVKTLDEALQTVAVAPYGPWVLGTMALGLIAFGVYSLVGAAWFRLRR